MGYTDRFSYVELSLRLWDKVHVIMVDALFDVFLDLIYKYVIENFCPYVHNGNWCVIPFLC